jgi:aldehyde dehydrogenase
MQFTGGPVWMQPSPRPVNSNHFSGQFRQGTGFRSRPRYDNFIGGKFTAPLGGQYFDNVSPITGQVFTQAARSTEADINLALDAAHAAAEAWGKTHGRARA